MIITNTEHNEFTQYVRILARGRNASRDMSQEEAKHAMTLLLEGKALPEQLGAFFMLMRVKEESPEELAGFAQACTPLWKGLSADIIWPSYAGKRRQPLWYLLSMQLIKDAGYSILMHGAHSHTADRQFSADICEDFGIKIAASHQQAAALIAQEKIAYLPCNLLHEEFQNWLMTKHTLGLRSPINTLLRLIAPNNCAGVQSVFHPNYGKTHQAACALIGKEALIMKGEGGEFEINPERTTQCIFTHRDDIEKIPGIQPHFEGKHTEPNKQALLDCWQNEVDEYGYHATLRTTAAVLMLKDKVLDFPQALVKATDLWNKRNKSAFN
ncbi:Putative glycosyl transferase, family 3 [Oleispira antarctica RB-8]|uniref:Putative glycosyl transferase, family 3 n=1 Tax=Oleispira antarctica RB-8 TaxID=698738 RepID=R4YS30_OLEAN|nr:Putative glycosyl transferase, family 3 [Oleispira antarctica RB-8]